jgi:hypothetical protein
MWELLINIMLIQRNEYQYHTLYLFLHKILVTAGEKKHSVKIIYSDLKKTALYISRWSGKEKDMIQIEEWREGRKKERWSWKCMRTVCPSHLVRFLYFASTTISFLLPSFYYFAIFIFTNLVCTNSNFFWNQ